MSNRDSSTTLKRCSTCGIEKPRDRFSKKSRMKDGLNSQCKDCTSAVFRRYYQENREAQLIRSKEYRTEHPIDKGLQCSRGKAYRLKYKSEISERRKARYATDHRLQEQNRARSAKWYEANRNRQSLFAKRYYQKNSDGIKKRIREYESNNSEKVRAWCRVKANKRRARLASSGQQYTVSDVVELLTLQKGRCANCRKPLKGRYHIDHKIHVAKGGDNSRHNIELLCPACNLAKAAKLPHEFAQESGRLL